MPPTDAAPDAELARLLDDYCRDYCVTGDGGDCRPMYASRAALLDYLARAYVRLPPPLDGEPVEMEEAAGDDYQRCGANIR
jgi:hypothetical protein